jgi:transcription elongation factor Elf1
MKSTMITKTADAKIVVNPFDASNASNHKYVEQNRVDLLRVLLDGKVKCSHCGFKFHSAPGSGTGMDKLSFTEWTSDLLPEKLMVTLYCGPCGHEGEYEMSPNPFMDVQGKIDSYGALVTAYRKENNAWPTESTTMKEVPRKPSFPVPGKE